MLNFLRHLGLAAARRLRRARADHALREELAGEIGCLEHAGELEGALANHGWSRGAVPYLLARYPGALRRHDAMRRRLGISPRHFVPRMGLGALDRSRTRCLTCPAADQCERWLDAGETGYAAFCPNRDTFARLRWQPLGGNAPAAG